MNPNIEVPRIIGPGIYTSAHSPQIMSDEKAARLYQKLYKFLKVVDSWGYNLPWKTKNTASQSFEDRLKTWPLAFRQPNACPICITWNPKIKGRNPTFAEFLRAFQITAIIE